MKGLFALLAVACMACGISLFAQVSISRADIASQVGVLRTSYQWDANDNVSGSMMPDTTGLQAVLQGEMRYKDVLPNPLRTSASILFTLERAGHVRAVVSNAEGREIVRLADEEFTAGSHLLQLEAGALPEGMYHLRMQYGETVITDKIVLCR